MLNKIICKKLNVQCISTLNACKTRLRGKQSGNMSDYPELPWESALDLYLSATHATIFCKEAEENEVQGVRIITIDHENGNFRDWLLNGQHLGCTWDSPSHKAKQNGACHYFAKFCLGGTWSHAIDVKGLFIPLCPEKYQYHANGTKLNIGEIAENSVLWYLHQLSKSKTKQVMHEADCIFYRKLFSIKYYKDSKFYLV